SVGNGSTRSEPFAKESRDRLASLMLNRWIRLEHEPTAGRAAYVMTEDGVCVNALLVREGLARGSARGSPVRLDGLKNAESDARSSRRGMWSGSAQIPSASYTRKSKKKRQGQ